MTGIVIPDGGTIGSASDTDAITISSTGKVTTADSELNVKTTSHTFTVKGVDEAIGDTQTGTGNEPDTTDSDSGQFAVYNGSTKLFGITEHGYVLKPNQPAFTATMSSNYSVLTDDSFGSIPFDTASSTVNMTGYDTSTYRFTASVSGLYYITSTLSIFGGNVADDTMIWGIHKNGSSHVTVLDNWRFQSSSGHEYVTSVGAVVSLDAGDYVNIKAGGMNANSANVDVIASYSWFSGYLIG